MVWDKEIETNEDLLRYWAEGRGSSDLLSYLPGLQKRFAARRAVLARHEEMNEESARSKVTKKLKELSPPTIPAEPALPGLWHLWMWADVVKLPWDWKCDGGPEFRKQWESSVATDGFQLQLAQLVYWWMAKKVNSDTWPIT